jgi:DNA-directed RNA polymerase specialized sigma subunit
MTKFEISAIIGYYRSGATFQEIGFILGISATYAEQIVIEYLKKKK